MKTKSVHLEATRIIHEQLRDTSFSPDARRKVRRHLRKAMKFFDLPELETILLSTLVQNMFCDEELDIRTLASWYGFNTSQMPPVYKAVEYLVDKGYVIKNYQGMGTMRRIEPMANVIDALMRDDSEKLKPRAIAGLGDILNEYTRIQKYRNAGSINHEQFIDQVLSVWDRSTHLPGVQFVNSIDMTKEERVMLLYMALSSFQGMDMVDIGEVIREVTMDTCLYYDLRAKFRNKELTLIKEDLVEFGMFDLGVDTEVSLTELAHEKLFSVEQTQLISYYKPTLSVLLTPESISPVELIFDTAVNEKLESISQALAPERYSAICDKMKERNLHGGMVILLHGIPGTGKTETVYQLARRTNRPILRLEISRIKAMWVGESEKNLKKVFTEYRKAKRAFRNDPILLFNEADAIFSKRRNASTSLDQMENSLQNILLQELEEFEGILIATTNLTRNLDPAFERRFLYKVFFDVPSVETRVKLLEATFKDIGEDELLAIASDHPLTGSTVENIKRKLIIWELTGDPVRVDASRLINLLEEEGISESAKKIGFKVIKF
jgi:hypothetical protein